MSQNPELPPIGPDGIRRWSVAGGVVMDQRGLLVVKNVRRNGRFDWTTPGGVIDPGETPLEALTREVREETGLEVDTWSQAVYRVEVFAPDLGFHLNVQAHRAERFGGDIVIDDPDGIVVAAEFMAVDAALEMMSTAQRWMHEPLTAHLRSGVDDGRLFSYRVDGKDPDDRVVTRLDQV